MTTRPRRPQIPQFCTVLRELFRPGFSRAHMRTDTSLPLSPRRMRALSSNGSQRPLRPQVGDAQAREQRAVVNGLAPVTASGAGNPGKEVLAAQTRHSPSPRCAPTAPALGSLSPSLHARDGLHETRPGRVGSPGSECGVSLGVSCLCPHALYAQGRHSSVRCRDKWLLSR